MNQVKQSIETARTFIENGTSTHPMNALIKADQLLNVTNGRPTLKLLASMMRSRLASQGHGVFASDDDAIVISTWFNTIERPYRKAAILSMFDRAIALA